MNILSYIKIALVTGACSELRQSSRN